MDMLIGIIITIAFPYYFLKNRKSEIIYKKIFAWIAVVIAILNFIVMANNANKPTSNNSQIQQPIVSTQMNALPPKTFHEIVFKTPCILGAAEEESNVNSNGVVFKTFKQECKNSNNNPNLSSTVSIGIAGVAPSKNGKPMDLAQIKTLTNSLINEQIDTLTNYVRNEGGAVTHRSLSNQCRVGKYLSDCFMLSTHFQEGDMSVFTILTPAVDGYKSAIVSGTPSVVNAFIRDNAIQK